MAELEGNISSLPDPKEHGRVIRRPALENVPPISQIDVDIRIMKATGLTDNEIARLALLKRRVDSGKCDEFTIEFKRLTFARLLAECGRIGG